MKKMSKLTRKDFAQGIIMLAELFNKGKTPSKMLQDIYWDRLKKYTKEKFEIAIVNIIDHYSYNTMPKPNDIISAIEGKPEDIEALAIRQWEFVKKAIMDHGAYRSLSFDDPIINHIILRYFDGWESLCQTLMDELKWKEKDFIKYYIALKKVGVDSGIEYLPGISDRSNSYKGFKKKHTYTKIITNIKKEQLAIEEKVKCLIEN